jgi:mono/diheme cytochrome c family protein
MGIAWQKVWRRQQHVGVSAWLAVFAVLLLLAGCGERREKQPSNSVAAVTPDSSAQAPATGDTVPPGSPDTSGADSTRARDTTDTSSRKATPAPKPAPVEKPTPAKKPAPKPAPSTPPPQPAETTAAQAPAPTTGGQAPSADAPLRDAYHQAPRDTVSQEVYDGWKQYNLNCARCHGEDVLGTTIAPHLIVSLKPDGPIKTKEEFTQVVCAGRPAKGMPAWCSLGLGMDKIQQIYSYVKGRSDAKIGPGRPAVRQ